MLKDGTPREWVLKETGWSRGVDGKWMWEIADDQAKFIPPLNNSAIINGFSDPRPLKEALQHPDLYGAYSRLGDEYKVKEFTRQVAEGQGKPGMMGGFNPKTKTFYLRDDMPDEEKLKVIMHEVQHGVQDIEKFPQGGGQANRAVKSVANAEFKEMMQTARDAMEAVHDARRIWINQQVNSGAIPKGTDPKIIVQKFWDENPDMKAVWDEGKMIYEAAPTLRSQMTFNAYERLAGEVQARNTMEARLKMTPEQRRDSGYWDTQDTPSAQQIVKYGNNGKANQPSYIESNKGFDDPAYRDRAQQMRNDGTGSSNKMYPSMNALERARGGTAMDEQLRQQQALRAQMEKEFAEQGELHDIPILSQKRPEPGMGHNGGPRMEPENNYGKSVDLPNLRDMPTEEAIRLAREEKHLIPGGAGTKGAYVGGPNDVHSYEDLQRVRKEIDDELAAPGNIEGHDWYSQARDTNDLLSGGRPEVARWHTKAGGEFSPGQSPEVEFHGSTRELNAAMVNPPKPVYDKKGNPVPFEARPGLKVELPQMMEGGYKAARPAQHQNFLRALYNNNPEMIATGRKTGLYADKQTPGHTPGATGVNDFRNQKFMRMKNPDGSEPSAENHLTGPTAHNWLDHEMALTVGRARDNKLGGKDDWNGEEIQAFGWVQQKAQALIEQAAKKGNVLSYEDALKRAQMYPGSFAQKHTTYATHEPIPSISSKQMKGLQDAPEAVRDAYSNDPRSTWGHAGKYGSDTIYDAYHVPGAPDAKMRQMPTVKMQGIWPEEGRISLNQGYVGRPISGIDLEKQAIAPEDIKLQRGAEATRGYIDVQDGSATSHFFPKAKAGEMNAAALPLKGPITREQAEALVLLGPKYGLNNVYDFGKGAALTNFYPNKDIDPKILGKVLKDDNFHADLKKIFGDDAKNVHRTKRDGVYMDYDWSQPEGSGKITKQFLKYMNEDKQVRAQLNESADIPMEALAKAERDAEYAKKFGFYNRQDVQNMRAEIAKGPGWIDRLEKAVKAGTLPLPAVAAFLKMQGVGDLVEADEKS
jgi:hypothetical protein